MIINQVFDFDMDSIGKGSPNQTMKLMNNFIGNKR